jgi:hypothetical protein
MTAEELIIGHYEKTLTSEQESHLSSMIESSPDVRVLYEQHGNVHSMLVEEAAAVKPSSKLDKVVVGAALGTLVEIAGHGIGFSILGKVASIVGVLAVGGIGYALYDNYIDVDDQPKPIVPSVVNQAPPVNNPPTLEVPATDPVLASPTSDPGATDAAASTPTNDRPAGTAATASTNADRTASDASKSKRPALNISNDKPHVVVKKPDTNVRATPNK